MLVVPERNQQILLRILKTGISSTENLRRRREKLLYMLGCFREEKFPLAKLFWPFLKEMGQTFSGKDKLGFFIQVAYTYDFIGEKKVAEESLSSTIDFVLDSGIPFHLSQEQISQQILEVQVHSMVKSQKYSQALIKIQEISRFERKDRILESCVDYLVKEELNQAVEFAKHFENPWKKERVMKKVALALANKNRTKESLDIALKIKHRQIQRELVDGVCEILQQEESFYEEMGKVEFVLDSFPERLRVLWDLSSYGFRGEKPPFTQSFIRRIWSILQDPDMMNFAERERTIVLFARMLTCFPRSKTTYTNLQEILKFVSEENCPHVLTSIARSIFQNFPQDTKVLSLLTSMCDYLIHHEEYKILSEIFLEVALGKHEDCWKFMKENCLITTAMNESISQNYATAFLYRLDYETAWHYISAGKYSFTMVSKILQREDLNLTSDFVNKLTNEMAKSKKSVIQMADTYISCAKCVDDFRLRYSLLKKSFKMGLDNEGESEIIFKNLTQKMAEIELFSFDRLDLIRSIERQLEKCRFLYSLSYQCKILTNLSVFEECFHKNHWNSLLRLLIRNLEQNKIDVFAAKKIFFEALPNLDLKDVIVSLRKSTLDSRVLSTIICDIQKEIVLNHPNPVLMLRETFSLVPMCLFDQKLLQHSFGMLQAAHAVEENWHHFNIIDEFGSFTSKNTTISDSKS
jgi:hypothetical protein